MNFIETFKAGKLGKNFGLSTGIDALDRAINGIQKKTTIGIAAAPKVGKTTLCDFSCVISPYLQMEKLGRLADLHFIYFSFEIDRVSKEYKFASFFMAHDHGIYNVTYKDKVYPMSQDYLMGKLLHKTDTGQSELVPVQPDHEEILKGIYEKRIIPLFGEYGENDQKISDGIIDFIEEPDNPTGMNKYLFRYAKQNGEFIEQEYTTFDDSHNPVKRKRIIGYKANNSDLFTIIVTDHVRKLRRERGFKLKENIDKWLEYSTFLRNICSFIFIHIVHSNREVANIDRLKFSGEFIFPTGDDVKDTGNLSEECTILITMFNPSDEKYNLRKHFGNDITNVANSNYRSIHVVESRYTQCPQHIVNYAMIGGINMFIPLNSYS